MVRCLWQFDEQARLASWRRPEVSLRDGAAIVCSLSHTGAADPSQ
jgi:hypothetical protein